MLPGFLANPKRTRSDGVESSVLPFAQQARSRMYISRRPRPVASAASPLRQPVSRRPDTERDSCHHQQQAADRGAWCVVGLGRVDAQGADGQAEGEVLTEP